MSIKSRHSREGVGGPSGVRVTTPCLPVDRVVIGVLKEGEWIFSPFT